MSSQGSFNALGVYYFDLLTLLQSQRTRNLFVRSASNQLKKSPEKFRRPAKREMLIPVIIILFLEVLRNKTACYEISVGGKWHGCEMWLEMTNSRV